MKGQHATRETLTGEGGRATLRAERVERDLERISMRLLLRPAVLGAMFAVTATRGIRWSADAPLRGWSGRPVILAANHESHVDTPAILGCLPPALRRRTAVAAASDTFGFDESGIPRTTARRALRAFVIAGFRAYPFDRHSAGRGSLELSAALLARGWSLLMFPEGTRRKGGAPRPFKPGIGWLADKSGAPVVPVHVAGGRRVLPPGAFWPQGGRVGVRFGAPIPFGAGMHPTEFANEVERAVRALGGGGDASDGPYPAPGLPSPARTSPAEPPHE